MKSNEKFLDLIGAAEKHGVVQALRYAHEYGINFADLALPA